MDYIGDRISVNRKANELSIVILSLRDKTKSALLLIWLMLWSLSAIVVISQYFTIEDANVKTTIIVWLGFWVYFEYKIIVAFLWRKNGAEKIRIHDGVLEYKRNIGGSKKPKEYKLDAIKSLRTLETKDTSFIDNINDSYWIIGGEKLTFDYYGADVKLGMQLNEQECQALLKLLKNKLSR